MEDDTEDLAIQLSTRIGMIMEDTSAAALTIRGLEPAERRAALMRIERASVQIHALLSAAKAMLV